MPDTVDTTAKIEASVPSHPAPPPPPAPDTNFSVDISDGGLPWELTVGIVLAVAVFMAVLLLLGVR